MEETSLFADRMLSRNFFSLEQRKIVGFLCYVRKMCMFARNKYLKCVEFHDLDT